MPLSMLPGRKARDRRWPVLIPAEVRAGAGWTPVRIHNISPSGMMLAGNPALTHGNYVEVRARGMNMVGRVAWTADGFCGVKLADRLDVLPFVSNVATARTTAHVGKRVAAEISAARALERARRIATVVRWTVAAVALAGASASIAHGVYGVLDAPFQRAADAMRRHGS